MKIVSDEYKVIAESLDGDARYIERITLDDGTVLTDKIEELKYSNMCNNSTNFSFGNTASAILEFQINMPTVELQDKEIVVEQGLELADGTIEYIKLGKFKVDSTETEAFRASYRCVDAMTYKMSTKYESQLTYPTTDVDVLEEVCAQAGISLVNSDLTSHTVSKKLENYTKREIIGIIAQLQGKNAIINADGNLELLWYENADYVIDDSRIYSDRTDIIKSEINYSLDYIVSNYGSTSIKVGDGDTGATISNPYMTQEILDEVFAKIGGFTFTTAEVDFYGDFRLEVGDIVSLQTDGVTYVLPVMTLEHNSDGGVVTTVGSVGETATQNSVDTNGKTLNELKRSVVNSETARSIAEQAADKISFVVEGDTASEFTVTENVIQATTEKLVIRTEKGGEVVIQNGIMYVDDIFAEEITATGSISGAKLYGTYIESKTGEIGGFTISNNALYNGTDSIGSTEDGVYLGTNGLKTVGAEGYVIHDGRQSTYKYFFTKDKSTDEPDSVVEIDGQGVILNQYAIDGEQVSDVYIGFGKEGVLCGYITAEGIVTGLGETAENAILSFKGNANLKTLNVSTDNWLAMKLKREVENSYVNIQFENGSGVLGYLAISEVDGKFKRRLGSDTSKVYDLIDSSGGTLSGNLGINIDTASWRHYEIKNSLRHIQIAINASGYFGFYDVTNSKWLLQSEVNGNGVSIKGNRFTLETSDATTASIRVKNSKRHGGVLVSDAGFLGLWDFTNDKWTLYSDASDNIFCNGALTILGDLQTHNVIPATNATSSDGFTLGNSYFKYRYLYAYSSSIQTSDKRYKTNINYIKDNEVLSKFFDALKPCTYFMVGGDRKHMGFIAQDVEEAMNQNGMTIDDLSFVCKDAEYTLKDEEKPDTEENREYTLDEDGNQKYIYGLKYTELHAMEVDQIQRLKTRVSDLEFALSQALARIEALEEKINQ